MAAGAMQFESMALGGKVEILNRPEFEAVPMTLDFTSVSDTDPATKRKVVKAGTPINNVGVKVATPWTDIVGILLFDVYEDRPQGTLLKKAYINSDLAQSHSGSTYDAKLVTALPMIVFEPAIGTDIVEDVM